MDERITAESILADAFEPEVIGCIFRHRRVDGNLNVVGNWTSWQLWMGRKSDRPREFQSYADVSNALAGGWKPDTRKSPKDRFLYLTGHGVELEVEAMPIEELRRWIATNR